MHVLLLRPLGAWVQQRGVVGSRKGIHKTPVTCTTPLYSKHWVRTKEARRARHGSLQAAGFTTGCRSARVRLAHPPFNN